MIKKRCGTRFHLVFILSLLAVPLVMYIYWDKVDVIFGGVGLEDERGVFGDAFGALNALFTGLAFVGLLATIHLQRQDLREQRVAFLKQRYEDTYFRMLSSLEINARNITWLRNSKSNVQEGRKAFKTWYFSVQSSKRNIGKSVEDESTIIFKSNLGDNKHLLLTGNEYGFLDSEAKPYMNMIFEILKFIYRLEDCERKFYLKVFNSQLSVYEKVAFFYYSLMMFEHKASKEMVVTSGLLEGLEFNVLFNPTHSYLYPDDAYLGLDISTTAKTPESQTSPPPSQ